MSQVSASAAEALEEKLLEEKLEGHSTAEILALLARKRRATVRDMRKATKAAKAVVNWSTILKTVRPVLLTEFEKASGGNAWLMQIVVDRMNDALAITYYSCQTLEGRAGDGKAFRDAAGTLYESRVKFLHGNGERVSTPVLARQTGKRLTKVTK